MSTLLGDAMVVFSAVACNVELKHQVGVLLLQISEGKYGGPHMAMSPQAAHLCPDVINMMQGWG